VKRSETGQEMHYADYAKKQGIKLELSKFRDHWRKFFNGQMRYLRHPGTKAGYETALEEWYLLKAQIDGQRDNIKVYNHHLALFNSVVEYWNAFGTPRSERSLQQSVIQFIELIQEQMKSPVLPERIRVKEFLNERQEFDHEFNRIDEEQRILVEGHSFRLISELGSKPYLLPNKWQDRIARMTPIHQDKKPQTIQYWWDDYFADMTKKHESNQITDSTYADRKYALASFRKFLDLQAHVTTLGNGLLDQYNDTLQVNKQIKKKSKISYMKTAKMFVRYCKLAVECALTDCPLLEKKYKYVDPQGTGRTRQQKKLMLWTSGDFEKALALPEPYRCFCLLFLNCGFRHIDLSHLQHIDIDSDNRRIVIQRHKLNKLETAPVISYKLWDATWDALQANMRTTGSLVFGDVHDAFKSWWKDNARSIGRLDYLRKTGSTIVAQYDRGLDDFYLGECMTTTAKVHYSFNDGEPCEKLDRAIQYLGSKFGLSDAPGKTVELTPEIIEALQKMGISA